MLHIFIVCHFYHVILCILLLFTHDDVIVDIEMSFQTGVSACESDNTTSFLAGSFQGRLNFEAGSRCNG